MSSVTQKYQLRDFFKAVYFVKWFHPQVKIIKFAASNWGDDLKIKVGTDA